ncbi:MAG: ParB/RepB/Spo0J family partition protein [Acidobacteriaceae bacterium]|nr:ParB/RepB/Spo0J family partition protein [Acidobacteriaceae bacterium]
MSKEPDKNPRKALGKGLSALLPNRASAAAPELASAAVPSPISPKSLPEHFEEFHSIPIAKISANEEQPRESFDDTKLQELAQSIRTNGLIQPITVYKVAPDQYRIIAGERRWRAAALAGLKEVPALVRSIERNKLLEFALIENVQREDLNPIEIATAFQRLAAEYGLSHEEIAQRTGKDRSTVTNFLRLLKLPVAIREEVIRGTLTVGHARALLNIQDPDEQWSTCQEVMAEGLSVRETERLVKDLTNPARPRRETKQKDPEPMDPNVRAALEEIAMALGTKVRLVASSEKAGRLEIEYYSQDDLDRIYSVIVRQ